ncbi:unnamed protein product [Lactuca saligna]|uniref:Uncharacterized protein n=1 Tax=Lactuca saligna TaxID=75948 RepID=A0AA36EBP2_LACSI|nr:unnamed protein product [Lactuca saligna]
MSHHPPPRPLPPRLILHRTTPEILKQTTTSMFSTGQNLLIFLVLFFCLFSLRVNVETTTHFLTSLIDNNPSIKSFINRENVPPNPNSPTSTITTTSCRRHFLQLSRVGSRILVSDFSSGDDESDHKVNATSFILYSFDLQLESSNFVFGNGIRVSGIVRSTAKMTFRSIKITQKEENVGIDKVNDSAPFNETHFQSFLKRFHLEHHQFTAIMILILAFAASYWFMVHVFVGTYTKIHGIIFVLVLNDFCNRRKSFYVTFSSGSFLGVERLSRSFIARRWVFRDVFIQLMYFWFLGGIDNPYSQLKIFIRSTFMPFSIMSPWDKGFEKEIFGFMASCFLMDMLICFVFDMGAWIVMADSRKNVKQVVKEGCYMVSLMIGPAIELKCYECIVCVLTRSFGLLFAIAIQSFMEVYFMVAWLLYYLSVKSIHANSSGQPFGQREIEAMLRDVRV